MTIIQNHDSGAFSLLSFSPSHSFIPCSVNHFTVFLFSALSHPSCLRCTSNGDKYLSCSLLSARATPRISCQLKHEQSRLVVYFAGWESFGGWRESVAGHQLSSQPALTPVSFHCWRTSLELVLPPASSTNHPFFLMILDSSFSL